MLINVSFQLILSSHAFYPAMSRRRVVSISLRSAVKAYVDLERGPSADYANLCSFLYSSDK